MRLDYWLYMNEASGSGVVKTKEGKLNMVGRELKRRGYAGKTVPGYIFESVCEDCGLNLSTLTEKDIRKIEEKWL